MHLRGPKNGVLKGSINAVPLKKVRQPSIGDYLGFRVWNVGLEVLDNYLMRFSYSGFGVFGNPKPYVGFRVSKSGLEILGNYLGFRF